MHRAIVGLLAVAAMVAAGCGAGDQADATSDPAPAAGTPADVVAAAEQRLGDSFAGGFVDRSGGVVVLTTDRAAAEQVRSLGATPKVVEHSRAELDDWQARIGAALGPEPSSAVTSWGVDVERNAVVVHVLVGQPVPPQLQQIADDAGDAVRLAEVQSPVVPLPGS